MLWRFKGTVYGGEAPNRFRSQRKCGHRPPCEKLETPPSYEEAKKSLVVGIEVQKVLNTKKCDGHHTL